MTKPGRFHPDQYAALPYIREQGELRVLLVTSRDTGRWIVPKGWRGKKTKPCEQAALEAFEEAGVIGTITRKPFGRFHYDKRIGDRSIACAVEVYLLNVEQELEDWPERLERTKRWMSTEMAAGLVEEAELAALLLRLDHRPVCELGGKSADRDLD